MSARFSQKLVLGSRGSELALRQTAMTAAALGQAWPELEIATEIISTRGDLRTAEPPDPRAGRKGLFTGEIERALAAGEIDVAVHSAKDLPSEMTPGLELAAVLPRAAAEDVLIGKASAQIGGVIATGSVRRRYQLQWKFPGVEVVDLRGNVPTRLRKLLGNDWQAIVLARAGLERLGFDLRADSFGFEGATLHVHRLSGSDFIPAGGQGIIALQTRSADENAKKMAGAVNHRDTFWCLQAEREFLRLLEGDCGSPVGVRATIIGSKMILRAQVFEPPRIEPRTACVEGEVALAHELARELWEGING